MPGGFQSDFSLANAQNISFSYTNPQFPDGGPGISPSATANTKGAWSQLISSAASDIYMLRIIAEYQGNGSSGNDGYALLDIGVGASGSEVVLIPNIIMGNDQPSGNGMGFLDLLIPISIPAGTRISARCQVNAASSISTISIGVWSFDSSFGEEAPTGYDAIGVSPSSSSGTVLSTTGQPGPFIQLVASAARDYCGLFVISDTNGNGNFSGESVDIAVGASGSEQLVLPASWGDFGTVYVHYYPIQIPAGERIAVRGTTQFGQTIDVIVYGAYL